MRKFIALPLLALAALAVAPAQERSAATPATPPFLERGTEPRNGSSPTLYLAYKVETRDSIEYGTDPEQDRWSEEQEREERIKQERSWRMLENMNIYKKSPGRRPSPSTQSNDQAQ